LARTFGGPLGFYSKKKILKENKISLPFKAIGVLEKAGYEKERKLHEQFKPYNLMNLNDPRVEWLPNYTEWFLLTPEILKSFNLPPVLNGTQIPVLAPPVPAPSQKITSIVSKSTPTIEAIKKPKSLAPLKEVYQNFLTRFEKIKNEHKQKEQNSEKRKNIIEKEIKLMFSKGGYPWKLKSFPTFFKEFKDRKDHPGFVVPERDTPSDALYTAEDILSVVGAERLAALTNENWPFGHEYNDPYAAFYIKSRDEWVGRKPSKQHLPY
jgi:hypothetical protein